MPHIHTMKNGHDFTTTAYIVRVDTLEPKALVHMHKKLKRLLAVGGHVEMNESPWQAIAHKLNGIQYPPIALRVVFRRSYKNS